MNKVLKTQLRLDQKPVNNDFDKMKFSIKIGTMWNIRVCLFVFC